MAVDDLYSATSYLIQHAEELHIDPSRIIYQRFKRRCNDGIAGRLRTL
jgi:hypothetical protein